MNINEKLQSLYPVFIKEYLKLEPLFDTYASLIGNIEPYDVDAFYNITANVIGFNFYFYYSTVGTEMAPRYLEDVIREVFKEDEGVNVFYRISYNRYGTLGRLFKPKTYSLYIQREAVSDSTQRFTMRIEIDCNIQKYNPNICEKIYIDILKRTFLSYIIRDYNSFKNDAIQEEFEILISDFNLHMTQISESQVKDLQNPVFHIYSNNTSGVLGLIDNILYYSTHFILKAKKYHEWGNFNTKINKCISKKYLPDIDALGVENTLPYSIELSSSPGRFTLDNYFRFNSNYSSPLERSIYEEVMSHQHFPTEDMTPYFLDYAKNALKKCRENPTDDFASSYSSSQHLNDIFSYIWEFTHSEEIRDMLFTDSDTRLKALNIESLSYSHVSCCNCSLHSKYYYKAKNNECIYVCSKNCLDQYLLLHPSKKFK